MRVTIESIEGFCFCPVKDGVCKCTCGGNGSGFAAYSGTRLLGIGSNKEELLARVDSLESTVTVDTSAVSGEATQQRTTKTTEFPAGGRVSVTLVHTERPNTNPKPRGSSVLCENHYEVEVGSDKTIYLTVDQADELKRIMSSFKTL